MIDCQTLQTNLDDGVLTVTLNRPHQLNAFTVEMANELVELFEAASADDQIRVIVVTGAGRAFCAGMDLSVDGNVFGLNESLSPDLESLRQNLDDPAMVDGVRDTGGRVTLAIFDCDKPVIAAINGAAVGIGATMTCAMDIRLASTQARVGFVFNKIGIVPEACSSWFLPRIVGIPKALEWTLTGDILDAQAIHEARFVTSLHQPDALLDAALRLARQIAAHSPVALALTRHMMYRNSAAAHPLEAHLVDSLAMHHTSQHDGKEGVAAFLEKRPAAFTARASSDMPAFYPWWST